MARKQVSRKRRVKKNIENGVAHIRSTFNNELTEFSIFTNFNCLNSRFFDFYHLNILLIYVDLI